MDNSFVCNSAFNYFCIFKFNKHDMNKLLAILYVFFWSSITASAQFAVGESKTKTAFKVFSPALITMENGDRISVKEANIFLRNSCLLYKHGARIMQADMDNVKAVDIEGRHYVKVDTMLAVLVDSANKSQLLASTVIDMEAYVTQMQNNRQFTNLEMREMVNYATIDLVAEEDKTYPLVKYFFYRINNKLYPVTERNVMKLAPKEKRRFIKSIIQSADFSWGSEDSLMKLLKSL